MMGNQSCQQAQVQKRSLKKIVELGSVKSPSIPLPNGGSFNFAFVASTQLAGVAQESQKFALRVSAPIIADPTISDNKYFNVTTADAKMVQKSFAAAGKSTDPGLVFSREAWCLVNLPQAKISTTINSFEAVSGVGLGIGFKPGGIIGIGAEASVNLESAQLALTMRADPPLLGSLTTNLWTTNVTADQTKTKLSFALDLAMLSIGPSYYYNTPLSDVTKKGLAVGLDQLAEKMTDEWYSRVMVDNDVEMILVGGRDVGLEVGDELKVYNENLGWKGEPCNSEYGGNTGTGEDSYYATITVTSVGDNLSNAKVVTISPNSVERKALTGAKVRLSRLHEDIEAAQPATAPKVNTPASTASSGSQSVAVNNKASRSK